MSTAAETLLAQGDVAALLAALDAMPVDEGAETAFQLQKTAYNDHKNAAANVAIGEWIVAHDDPSASTELRGRVKGASYNLASAVWRGWDEPGITLTPALEAKGLPMAELNLKLAYELDKPTIAKSRGHWLVGAHQWSAGNIDAAVAEFNKASQLALEADSPDEAKLSDAYAQLAQGDPAWRATADSLKDVEYGDFFIGQLEAAARVFGVAS